ncbi:hypothetical protein [Nodularia sphaerocarpa]|uniref:hypothetical protein n=1 Tax=Nodularia sphaerocarpa TaxID=137816 RepID=UPI001EFC0E9C|nr:hypothetical protein [Nodularia sphaerocarpa]MDB9374330.1 hypothetical protein [Nodularia sphaerocarpa CS-585]ULP73889.1 hypothetical protein BDGGKGIB_03549 [Nodularia sphaerocarpa UHCC 0038]
MANLEKIVNELPQLVLSLKLNLGNSQEILQQVVLINNIQDQLRQLQQIIIEELRFVKLNNSATYSLPPLGTIISPFVPNICAEDTETNAIEKYITAKFANPNTAISINDLPSKIDDWIEWGDLLHVISADILSDSELVNQLNSHRNHSNLSAQVQKLSEKLKINLAFTNREILQQQLQEIRNAQTEALQVKEKLNEIFTTINIRPNFFTILLGVSCFCGTSGFSLEWWDDEQELIISSDGKFQELSDMLQEYAQLQETVDTLIININTFRKQAEASLNNFPQETQIKPVIYDQPKVISKFTFPKIFHPLFIIASSFILLIFSGWMFKNKIPYFQQMMSSQNQEETAVNNFKSALQLGLEASSLGKNSPHPVIVWEQAETKWEKAIDLLASIPEGTSVYTPASGRLVSYRLNRIAIKERAISEKKATENLLAAQKLATEASFFVQNSPQSVLALTEAKSKLQQAISLLENIPQSTSIYEQAQAILPSYKSSYAGINIIIKD